MTGFFSMVSDKDFPGVVNLNIDYIHPSKWLEEYKSKSLNLQSSFKLFEEWIGKKFDKEVSTYIYGGNISGCIAFSFLKTMKMVSVQGVIDQKFPFPYLQAVSHIIPENFTGKPDLVFVSVCPIHYSDIQKSFVEQFNYQPAICYMFKSNCDQPDRKKYDFKKKHNALGAYRDESQLSQSRNIMLGDSLTTGFQYDKLLLRSDVINKGIDGAMVFDILLSIDSVLEQIPHTIFIMIGINDILQGTSHRDVFRVYGHIIDKILEKGVNLYIQSTLYISPSYPSVIDIPTINREVCCLNNLLKDIGLSRSLVFLDLNRTMASRGYLDPEFTHDGLHLNTHGYDIWGSAIVPLFQ